MKILIQDNGRLHEADIDAEFTRPVHSYWELVRSTRPSLWDMIHNLLDTLLLFAIALALAWIAL